LYQATNSVAAQLPGRSSPGIPSDLSVCVVAHQIGMRHVDADVHVAEEATAALERLAVEQILQALDLLVVGGDPAAQQTPRRGQSLEQVDLRVAARSQQARGGERPGRPRADDRHSRSCAGRHPAVRSAVLCSLKNSPLRSSA
jgi:hypothetical protein